MLETNLSAKLKVILSRRVVCIHDPGFPGAQNNSMPSSPAPLCSDCSSRAIDNTRYCETHQKNNRNSERDKQHDRWRDANDPIRKLYKTAHWRAVRSKVLRRDILCVMCKHRAATEVDHILSARIVVDNFGENEFFNSIRLQGLCHSCHSEKTASEYGWGKHAHTQHEPLGDRTNTTVVCCAAGSDAGRSYVDAHKQQDDLVWDWDVAMSETTGLPLHQSVPGATGSVLAQRDNFIASTQYCKSHVWIIVSNPQAKIIRMLIDAGANQITIS